MSYWGMTDEERLEQRRRAAANLVKIRTGGYARERYEAEKRKQAEKEKRQQRIERRKEVTSELKTLRAELKDQEKLYKLLERGEADIGLRDEGAVAGAMEEVDHQIENLTIRINKLLEEKELLR